MRLSRARATEDHGLRLSNTSTQDTFPAYEKAKGQASALRESNGGALSERYVQQLILGLDGGDLPTAPRGSVHSSETEGSPNTEAPVERPPSQFVVAASIIAHEMIRYGGVHLVGRKVGNIGALTQQDFRVPLSRTGEVRIF